MTSPSDITKLRGRVLYYWALSRQQPIVELSHRGICKLLQLDEWDPREVNHVLKELQRAVICKQTANGIRISMVSPDAIKDVFAHWQTRTGKTRTKLTTERRTRIRRMLSSFSAEQLKCAIDGIMKSPWHTGENPNGTRYIGIGNVFKDADQVERFIELAGDEGGKFLDAETEAIKAEWAKRRRQRDHGNG